MEAQEARADGGLRERSKARRREAIIRAALELFADRGYDATTIADIAAKIHLQESTADIFQLVGHKERISTSEKPWPSIWH